MPRSTLQTNNHHSLSFDAYVDVSCGL